MQFCVARRLSLYALTLLQVKPRWLFGGEQHSSGGRPARAQPLGDLDNLQGLVLVACHAVFIGSDYGKAEDLTSWQLLPYQQVLETHLQARGRTMDCSLRRTASPHDGILVGPLSPTELQEVFTRVHAAPRRLAGARADKQLSSAHADGHSSCGRRPQLFVSVFRGTDPAGGAILTAETEPDVFWFQLQDTAAPQLVQLQRCAAVKAPPLRASAMHDALAAAPGWLTLRGPELLVSQRCLRVVWACRGPQQSRYRGSLAALGLLAV